MNPLESLGRLVSDLQARWQAAVDGAAAKRSRGQHGSAALAAAPKAQQSHRPPPGTRPPLKGSAQGGLFDSQAASIDFTHQRARMREKPPPGSSSRLAAPPGPGGGARGKSSQEGTAGWTSQWPATEDDVDILPEWKEGGEPSAAVGKPPPGRLQSRGPVDSSGIVGWEESKVAAVLPGQVKAQGPVTREELGRATWTFLHTLAAQFPERPTRQQQRDVRELVGLLTRIYPCRECADHFKEVVRVNPPHVGSGVELAQWMCRVHNVVNRSLNKEQFPCQRVDVRWGALHCEEGACTLQGRPH